MVTFHVLNPSINIVRRRIHLLGLVASISLVSCTSDQQTGKSPLTSALTQISKLSAKVQPPTVRVVKVREKDLKTLPSGQERAQAYANRHLVQLSLAVGTVDFKESALPQAGGEMDGSLLPPKAP